MAIICPAVTPITSLVAQTCPELFDQILGVAFQEADQSTFATEVALQTLATWTPLLVSVTATKIQVAKVFNPIIAASEALTAGGNDNTTPNGIPDYNGEGFTDISWEFRNLTATNKRALLDYSPHSIASVSSTNLTAFFFLRGNKILYNTVDGTEFTGFPVFNLRISSVSSQGLNAQNIYQAGVAVGEGWDNFFATTLAAFTLSDVLA